MTFIAKGAAAGVALALSLGAASLIAEARTSGNHDHPANHGMAVSAVAKSDSTSGEAHGDAVSAVARSDAGGTHAASTPAPSTHGSAVSTLATTTPLMGEAKGDAISALARNGHGKTQ